jgi:hypothetical protein
MVKILALGYNSRLRLPSETTDVGFLRSALSLSLLPSDLWTDPATEVYDDLMTQATMLFSGKKGMTVSIALKELMTVCKRIKWQWYNYFDHAKQTMYDNSNSPQLHNKGFLAPRGINFHLETNIADEMAPFLTEFGPLYRDAIIKLTMAVETGTQAAARTKNLLTSNSYAEVLISDRFSYGMMEIYQALHRNCPGFVIHGSSDVFPKTLWADITLDTVSMSSVIIHSVGVLSPNNTMTNHPMTVFMSYEQKLEATGGLWHCQIYLEACLMWYKFSPLTYATTRDIFYANVLTFINRYVAGFVLNSDQVIVVKKEFEACIESEWHEENPVRKNDGDKILYRTLKDFKMNGYDHAHFLNYQAEVDVTINPAQPTMEIIDAFREQGILNFTGLFDFYKKNCFKDTVVQHVTNTLLIGMSSPIQTTSGRDAEIVLMAPETKAIQEIDLTQMCQIQNLAEGLRIINGSTLTRIRTKFSMVNLDEVPSSERMLSDTTLMQNAGKVLRSDGFGTPFSIDRVSAYTVRTNILPQATILNLMAPFYMQPSFLPISIMEVRFRDRSIVLGANAPGGSRSEDMLTDIEVLNGDRPALCEETHVFSVPYRDVYNNAVQPLSLPYFKVMFPSRDVSEMSHIVPAMVTGRVDLRTSTMKKIVVQPYVELKQHAPNSAVARNYV